MYRMQLKTSYIRQLQNAKFLVVKGGEGRSKVWWPMEGSMLGGQWNVPSLVTNGR